MGKTPVANCAPKPKKQDYPHVEAAILHFGGAVELARMLKKRRRELNLEPISESGINKWRSRGSIPIKHLIALQKLGEVEKKPFKIEPYLRQLAVSSAA